MGCCSVAAIRQHEVNQPAMLVNNWNSANNFILFGKRGQLASNRADEQEISMLALHLPQLSLVYNISS